MRRRARLRLKDPERAADVADHFVAQRSELQPVGHWERGCQDSVSRRRICVRIAFRWPRDTLGLSRRPDIKSVIRDSVGSRDQSIGSQAARRRVGRILGSNPTTVRLRP
jgi:hypothetical protein